MKVKISHNRYLVAIGCVFAAWSLAWAVSPHDRGDWALENVLVFAFVIGMAFTYRSFPLSRVSITFIFLFLCLHEIGAHYTYSNVPYNEWTEKGLGFSLNELLGLERNHFDRLVHFSYGLLLAYPIREGFIRIVNVRGFWAYFLPLDVTMSSSMLFELFEWGAAEFFGGELGAAYLGTQGDIWDAHKDMALASLGALTTMTITAMINIRLQRDFAKEWNDSLKIKNDSPLGEDAIIKMMEEEEREAGK